MNAGLFIFIVLAVIAVAFWIYTETPSGKNGLRTYNAEKNQGTGSGTDNS